MHFVTYFLAVYFKKMWCQILEDGKIIVSKHVGAMQKVVSINYRIVQLLVFHE